MSDVGLVQKTVWILRVVAAHPQGVGLSDVSREASIPKATCHRILTLLEQENWLTVDRETHRYRVSLGLLFLVGGLLDQEAAYGHAQSVLRELSEATRETAGLDQLAPPSVMVVAQVQGPHLISHAMKPVPRTLPVWTTSTGKTLLAWQDEKAAREQFGEDFQQHQPHDHVDLNAFFKYLGEVRERGYGYAFNELEPGAAAVAAPVHVGDQVPYAIWIGGPSFRLTRERIPTLAGQVIDAANRLGKILEISGGSLQRADSDR